MVNFFSKRKRNDTFKGFGRYHDEIERYTPTTPQNVSSSQVSSSAAAAAAAVRLHSPTTTQSQFNNVNAHARQTPSRRTSSLTRNSTPLPYINGQDRTNSLRSYSYHPRASYVAGQPAQKPSAAPPSARVIPRRYNSLTNATRRLNSISSQNSNARRHSIDDLGQEIGEDEEVTITTQTTELVDAQGRTQSITTRTIKQLPDGSNIIETITKSVSRGGSRANSLRADSLAGRQNANTSLTIIDEDLQDFDYNYHLDNPKLAAAVPLVLNQHGGSVSPPNQHPVSLPKLNPPPPLNENPPIERNSSLVLNGSNRPLKLIMKHRPQDADSEPDYADARDSFAAPTSPILGKSEFSPPPYVSHPYKSLSNSPTSPLFQSKKLGPTSNAQDSQLKSNQWSTSHETSSQISGNNSIKFNNVVETINYTPDDEREHYYPQVPVLAPPMLAVPETQSRRQLEHQLTDEEMYAAAIEAAKRKVYGDRLDDITFSENGKPLRTTLRSPASPQSPNAGYNATVSNSSPVATSATSSAFSKARVGAVGTASAALAAVTQTQSESKVLSKKASSKQGIPKDYQYKSHNKPLSAHTLRGSENIKSASVEQKLLAKQKEKEEKELEKQERDLQKKQQKEEVRQQKLAAKELAKQKKLEAKSLKKPHKGFLFFRRPSLESTSDQSNHRISTDANTTNVVADTTLESDSRNIEPSIPISIPLPVKDIEHTGEGSEISKSVLAVIENYNSEDRLAMNGNEENVKALNTDRFPYEAPGVSSLRPPKPALVPDLKISSSSASHSSNSTGRVIRVPTLAVNHVNEEDRNIPSSGYNFSKRQDDADLADLYLKDTEKLEDRTEFEANSNIDLSASETHVPEPSSSIVSASEINESEASNFKDVHDLSNAVGKRIQIPEATSGSYRAEIHKSGDLDGSGAKENTLIELDSACKEASLPQAQSEFKEPGLHTVESDLHPVESDLHPVESDLHPVESDLHPVKADLHPVEADLHPVEADLQSVESDLPPVDSEFKESNSPQVDSHVNNDPSEADAVRKNVNLPPFSQEIASERNFIVVPATTTLSTNQQIGVNDVEPVISNPSFEGISGDKSAKVSPRSAEDIYPSTRVFNTGSEHRASVADDKSRIDYSTVAASGDTDEFVGDVQDLPLDNSVVTDTLNVTNESYDSFTPDVSRNVRESGHFIEVLDSDNSQTEDENDDVHTIEQTKTVEGKAQAAGKRGDPAANADNTKALLDSKSGVANLEDQKQVPKKLGRFRRNVLKYFVNGYDKI